MSVRAKFYCASKTEQASPGSTQKQVSITLQPVTNGSDENKQFYQYTPSGKLELNIINPAAASQFEVGKEYYVDFTPAE